MSKKEKKYKDEEDILPIHREAYESVYNLYKYKLKAFRCPMNMPRPDDCEEEARSDLMKQQKRLKELIKLLDMIDELIEIMWSVDKEGDYDDENYNYCIACQDKHCPIWKERESDFDVEDIEKYKQLIEED